MKTISLKIPADLDAKLRAKVRRSKKSKSALVRQALAAFVKEHGEIRPGSALDRLRDYAGMIKGPGDLSYNKKYLEGYGQ